MVCASHLSLQTCHIRFSSSSLFKCLYFVIQVSDCTDQKRTMVLQTVLVMHIFSSLVPRTRMFTYSCLDHLGRTTGTNPRALNRFVQAVLQMMPGRQEVGFLYLVNFWNPYISQDALVRFQLQHENNDSAGRPSS